MRFRPLRLAIALLGMMGTLGLLPATAQAAPEVEVVVECPLLSDEERAAVEARVRADLMVKQVEPGRMRITCGVDGSSVHWTPVERREVSESGPIVEDVKISDQLVELVDRVTTRVLEADATAEPPPVEKAPPESEKPEENKPSPPAGEDEDGPDQVEDEPPSPELRQWSYDSPHPEPLAGAAMIGAQAGFGGPVLLLPAVRVGAGVAVSDDLMVLGVGDLIPHTDGAYVCAGLEFGWRAYNRIWLEGGLGAAWTGGAVDGRGPDLPMLSTLARVRYGKRDRPVELLIGPELRLFIGPEPDVWGGLVIDLRLIL